MESLKALGRALLDLVTAIVNALGGVVKNHPKFFGIIIAVAGFFLACMISPAFMDFAAQVIALLMIGGLVYLVFFKKSEKPKPSAPRRNNRRGR